MEDDEDEQDLGEEAEDMNAWKWTEDGAHFNMMDNYSSRQG